MINKTIHRHRIPFPTFSSLEQPDPSMFQEKYNALMNAAKDMAQEVACYIDSGKLSSYIETCESGLPVVVVYSKEFGLFREFVGINGIGKLICGHSKIGDKLNSCYQLGDASSDEYCQHRLDYDTLVRVCEDMVMMTDGLTFVESRKRLVREIIEASLLNVT